MDKDQTQIANRQTGVVIVGAGPAGASLAIRLAGRGLDVTLVERDKFPRHKLCGEFVSPECLLHFAELGVLDEMLAIGGDRITQTIFYAPNGRSVSVPSEWFGNKAGALSISRAEMDLRLIAKAREVGVDVFEETPVIRPLFDSGAVSGVRVRSGNGDAFDIAADLTIDASGRANVLGKLVHKLRSPEASPGKIQRAVPSRKGNPPVSATKRLVGFKAHLKNVSLEPGRCEIHFFDGGYGGLSYVENGLANHCFLVKAEIVRQYIGQTNSLIDEVVFRNVRARETMADATPVFDWINVAVDGFGTREVNPAPNLLCVGDSAAFIDPFTGSGMLMALEGAAILAETIADNALESQELASEYAFQFDDHFRRRLRICSILRRAAFMPRLAGTAIAALSLSGVARKYLARATRPSKGIEKNDLKI